MIRVLALLPTLVCCTRLEQYRCETDAQCSREGAARTCEDTRFCSADDSDCPSRRRYVDEAGGELGGTCVIDNAMYLSPDGDDEAEGTRYAPWRTFSRALAALRQGDTLILHDGTYGNDEGTGFADIDCRDGAIACEGGPCRNGTADQPITVRALHERQAFVRSNGVGGVIAVKGCRSWTLEGLRAEQGDFSVSRPDEIPVAIEGASDVVLRRLLSAKPTRLSDAAAMEIRDSTRVLVEECEVLDFHRWGILVTESSDVVIRRSYLNPRGRANLPETPIRDCAETGDVGVSSSYTRTILVENTISEGACYGFQVDAGRYGGNDSGAGDDGLYAGNIAMDARIAGFSIRTDCTQIAPCSLPDQWAAGNHFVDDVAIECRDGFSFRGGQDNVIERCTALNSNNAGVWFDELPETRPLAFPSSAYAVNTLVADGENGFVVQDQAAWSIDHAVADVAGVAYSPDDANVTNRQDLDPELGQCRVALPETSPLRGAGLDGADIGATIVNRYENGVLTDTPLWLEGGAFPCGAVVPGVNDEPGQSCTDVHERLNVGPDGCPQR